jgi:hypothetical protein
MRKRVNQQIDAFERPQFTHEHHIACVRLPRKRFEFFGGDAVVHDARERRRHSHLGKESALPVVALEQEQIGAPQERAFGSQVRHTGRRAPRIMQASETRMAPGTSARRA